MPPDPANLIWIDLEMTGLDPERDHIIEIATIITDSSLEEIAEGPVLAVHQDDGMLAGMDEWNRDHHTRSGLVARVRDSDYEEADAERATLAFLEEHVPAGASPMCGNSVCQDRRFLHRYMRELERYFHYRHIDVSTVKELCARWAPAVAARVSKSATHRALDDIRESVEELRLYRRHLFKLEG